MILLSVALLVVFCFIERKAGEPIVPLDLFQLRIFKTCAAVATLAPMGVFGAITYIPLYLQGVLGSSASGAGMVLLFLSMAWTAGSLLAAPGMNRFGYRSASAAGMILLALGYSIFVFMVSNAGTFLVVLSGVLIGIGMGLANLTTLVAVQNSVWPQKIGVATSTIMLLRTFGGAFIVSLMGTVLLNHMQKGLSQLGGATTGTLSATLRDKLAQPQNLLDPATRAQIPSELLPKLVGVLADSIWYAFLTVFALMLLGIVLSFLMPNYTPATTPKPRK
jgi:predicted MFS family arabinose efflux permease